LLYDLTSCSKPPTRATPSAAHTLTLAQSLYEKTFITYPHRVAHLSSSVNRELWYHVEAASVGPYLPFIHTILAREA
jgi:DNA topoisomerase IA